jgi:RNA polymerase sigma-70 factor (ECF subfamily)
MDPAAQRVCYNPFMEETSRQGPSETREMGFDPRDLSLRALLSGITGQDESALAALYDATASRLFTLALRITGKRETAEEVVSDVYWQIWRQAALYDPARGSVLAWIYAICRSRALDCLRRRDTAETHPEPAGLCGDAACPEDGPLDALLHTERDSEIHIALATLDSPERQILALWFYRDWSHQQIADHTGMPLGTVKTVLRKAIGKMKVELGDPLVSWN